LHQYIACSDSHKRNPLWFHVDDHQARAWGFVKHVWQLDSDRSDSHKRNPLWFRDILSSYKQANRRQKMVKTFPTLYKRASTGKQQEWTISVDGNVITTRFGQTGGEIQETSDTITQGKNVGRANETTPAEQAAKEAEAKWTKKLKKDYCETPEKAMSGGASELIEGGVLPMLAQRFDKHGDKIVYPAFAQPKLDGHRCIAMIDCDGKCTLWTRTRKPIKSMPHIVAAIESMDLALAEPVCLDGELYNHAYRDNFEHITHLIKRDTPAEGHEDVQFHVYDCVWPDDPTFAARNKILDDFKVWEKWGDDGPLVRVETIEVASEDELMVAFESFLKQGYEGAIVRNAAGAYVNKRSYDLQKVKEMAEDEFEIIGVKEGRGKLQGHAIFVCQTAAGAQFEAKMKGELGTLKQYWDDPSLAVGRQLTVQYQGLTNALNVPRFPVGIRFREDL
jgi:DNA ligase-1